MARRVIVDSGATGRIFDHAVCTLDSDFAIYRKHKREPIPLITPSGS